VLRSLLAGQAVHCLTVMYLADAGTLQADVRSQTGGRILCIQGEPVLVVGPSHTLISLSFFWQPNDEGHSVFIVLSGIVDVDENIGSASAKLGPDHLMPCS
jgi:hypothetical protein